MLKEAKGKPVNADQMEIGRLKAELAKTRMERDLLKKQRRICEGVAVRYAIIERHEKVWPITTQCRVLAVSASGYHQHRARGDRTACHDALHDDLVMTAACTPGLPTARSSK